MTSATASHSQVEDGTLTQELIEKYSPYVSRAGTTYQFTPPEELRVAAPDEVALVEQTVSTTNVSIASGRIEVAGEDGATYYLDMQPSAFEDNGSHGGVEMKWWGHQLWLDDWASQKLRDLLTAGAGISAIAAEVTSWTGVGGLSGGAIAGIIALGSAGLDLCNWNGNGITLNVPYTAPAAPSWCWPR